MSRDKFPNRRAGLVTELREGEIDYKVGWTPKTQSFDPGEIFISCAKVGSPIEALARDGAIIASIALQYGATIDEISAALTQDDRGRPATIIGAVADLVKREAEAFRLAQAEDAAE